MPSGWAAGGQAVTGQAALASRMGSLRADVMTWEANLVALTDLSGSWIDRIHNRRPVTFSYPVRRGGTQQEISYGASTCGALPSAKGQVAPANEAGLL